MSRVRTTKRMQTAECPQKEMDLSLLQPWRGNGETCGLAAFTFTGIPHLTPLLRYLFTNERSVATLHSASLLLLFSQQYIGILYPRQIQIFVIVRPFKTLLPSRVMILCFGDILCSCGNCFETPHIIFIHKSDFNISM